MVNHMIYLYQKGGNQMSKKKHKKMKKSKIDWKTLTVNAISDLIIGIILLLISKLIG